MRKVIALIFVLSVLLAGVLVWCQGPSGTGEFEYGMPKPHTGILHEGQTPMLEENRTTYLLVGEGKHGIAHLLQGLGGRRATLQGTLIHRDGVAMLQVSPGSVQISSGGDGHDAEMSLGHAEFMGEIVDAKCYLGVMNPGEGKVHRECAARCISGGVPPALLARDANGQVKIVMLESADGSALGHRLLQYVAEPVRVRGVLFRRGTIMILRTDPAQIRRE